MGGGLWFWAKEVLVGSGGLGVSRNFPGKSSPSSPFFTLPTPFSPLDPFLQFFHPLNASLQLSRAGLYQPFLPSHPSFSSFNLLRPLSDLLRTPPESLHRVSQRPQKALFRGTPQNPPKRG